MSKCKALHNRCFVECKKKILNITHVCSEVVRLVLEYTQECDYIWLKGFFFPNSRVLGRLYTRLLSGNL